MSLISYCNLIHTGFIQVSITAIANLMAQSANEDKEMKTHFDLDEVISTSILQYM